METPQVENGFIRIATDIGKYLAKTYMSSYESQVVWAIFLKTYGYNKKEDWISNSQFVEITGIHKAHVSRTLKKLLQRKIVTQTGNKISFQKDSRLWCELPKQVTIKKLPKQVQELPIQDTKLPKQADTIDNIQKTITIDNTLPNGNVGSVNYLIGLFKDVNPSYKTLYPRKGERQALERMVKEHGLEKIEQAIKSLALVINKPYAPIITTPYELEKKLGNLIAFLQKERITINKFSVLKL